MGVSLIEGTIEESEIGRSPPLGNATIYKRVGWNSAQGPSELKRFVVDREMDPWLEEGRSGEYFSYTLIDQKGLYAYRGADGEEVYAWPSSGRFIGNLLSILGAGLLLFTFLLSRDVTIIGILVTALGIAFLATDAQNRKAGRELFESRREA